MQGGLFVNNNIKRVISLLLCVFCAAYFSSCSEFSEFASNVIEKSESLVSKSIGAQKDPASAIELETRSDESSDYDNIASIDIKYGGYNKIDLTHGYNSLETDSRRELYKLMQKCVYNISGVKGNDGYYSAENIVMYNTPIDQADIMIVLEAFTADNPEIFWLENLFGYIKTDGDMYIQFYSVLSPQEITSYSRRIKQKTDSILSALSKNLTEFERELYLHDKLLEICRYDYDATEENHAWQSYGIYGALVDGKAVCEGYTKAMQYLLSYAGIESIPINGKYNDSWHQWNLVKIEGQWYHLDATWDDSNDYDDYIFYSYFNITDSRIKEDHIICDDYTLLYDEEICGSETQKSVLFNLNIPSCTSEKDNFYIQKAVQLYSFDSDCTALIESELLKTAQDEKTQFYIAVSNTLDFEYAIQSLFYQEPYMFFQYASDVNNMLDGKKIDLQSVSLLTRDSFRIAEVCLKYV